MMAPTIPMKKPWRFLRSIGAVFCWSSPARSDLDWWVRGVEKGMEETQLTFYFFPCQGLLFIPLQWPLCKVNSANGSLGKKKNSKNMPYFYFQNFFYGLPLKICSLFVIRVPTLLAHDKKIIIIFKRDDEIDVFKR